MRDKWHFLYMVQETLKLYTSIKPDILRYLLLKGTVIAGAGILFLTYIGMFIKPDNLYIIGIPSLLIGGAMIYFGLAPYRRLYLLDNSPNALTLIDDRYLQYEERGKRIVTIPVSTIQKMEYIEDEKNYGIALWLEKGFVSEVITHQKNQDLKSLQKKAKKQAGSDVFFPYFSRRSFTRVGYITHPIE